MTSPGALAFSFEIAAAAGPDGARRPCRVAAPTLHLSSRIPSMSDVQSSAGMASAGVNTPGAETRYRRLFETAQDGILILDADTGRIIDVNPFLSTLLGFTREEFLGKELWEVGLLEDAARNRVAAQELRERGYIRYENLPLRSKLQAKGIDVEFVSNRYVDNGHEVIQCNIRDITDRKRLERETRKLARTLTEADQRKDEFLAMVSHELRAPLAPIMTAMAILRSESESESPRQRQALAIIERQVTQLSRLVGDLMDLSGVATGRIRLQFERIDLRKIVHRALDVVQSTNGPRQHNLVTALPDRPAWVRGDAARLEQVALNLLSNAVKYTDDGGVISVSVSREADHVELRVADTGVGMAADDLARVFDLFMQVDTSRDRSQGGLGIGLNIVQRLVELHGGTVRARSDGLGAGSEFIVSLPAALLTRPRRGRSSSDSG